MNDALLQTFFSKSFEEDLNEKMLYRNYQFPEQGVIDYVNQLVSVPFSEYIAYVIDRCKVSFLSYDDIMQFSSFEDATVNICSVLKNAGDNGYKALDIGKMLENDGVERTDVAYRKYGENHAKSATQLGLVHCMSNTFLLTCLGYVVNDLTPVIKNQLISRLILRNKFIQRLILQAHKNDSVNYYEEASFLKTSTAKRRSSNIKKLLMILSKDADYYLTNQVTFSFTTN